MKSTFGCALVSILIVTPFCINNFIQGRYLLGVFTLAVTVLGIINAWLCYRGRYHGGINLFGVAPVITIVCVVALHELGAIGSYWPYLGVLSFYFILPEKKAWVASIIFIGIVVPVGWNVLELPVAIRFVAVLLGTSFFSLLSIREINKQHYMLKEKLEKEQHLNSELQSATGRVNQLHGMLPICANCKKIRDDQGYYQQIEHYITEHSDAEFTHGICPDCAKELYPEIEYPDS